MEHLLLVSLAPLYWSHDYFEHTILILFYKNEQQKGCVTTNMRYKEEGTIAIVG